MPNSRPVRAERAAAHHGALSDFGEQLDEAPAREIALVTVSEPTDAPHAPRRPASHATVVHPPTPPHRTKLRPRRDTHGLAVVRDAPHTPVARTVWAAALTRTLDVVGALVGLMLSLPLLLIVAPLIRLDSRGPILFGHTRLGRGGRSFACYKLRTMCADAEAQLSRDPLLEAAYRTNGYKLPAHQDRRVTSFGRMLRITSIDEIPQFWNVLRGDMALVGPRPIVADEIRHYMPAEQQLLLSVRPGITGAWAVGGRSRVGYPERARIELDYIVHWSLLRDLVILARTIGAVLGRRGAS